MKQGVFRGAIRDGVSSDKTDLISCMYYNAEITRNQFYALLATLCVNHDDSHFFKTISNQSI